MRKLLSLPPPDKPRIKSNMNWENKREVILLAKNSTVKRKLSVIKIKGEKKYKIIRTSSEEKITLPFTIHYRT